MATAKHVLPPLPPRRRVAPLISPFAQIKTKAVGRRAAAGEPGMGTGNGDGDEETLGGEEQKLQIELMERRRVLSRLSALAGKRQEALEKLQTQWRSSRAGTSSIADDASEEEALSALSTRLAEAEAGLAAMAKERSIKEFMHARLSAQIAVSVRAATRLRDELDEVLADVVKVETLPRQAAFEWRGVLGQLVKERRKQQNMSHQRAGIAERRTAAERDQKDDEAFFVSMRKRRQDTRRAGTAESSGPRRGVEPPQQVQTEAAHAQRKAQEAQEAQQDAAAQLERLDQLESSRDALTETVRSVQERKAALDDEHRQLAASLEQMRYFAGGAAGSEGARASAEKIESVRTLSAECGGAEHRGERARSSAEARVRLLHHACIGLQNIKERLQTLDPPEWHQHPSPLSPGGLGGTSPSLEATLDASMSMSLPGETATERAAGGSSHHQQQQHTTSIVDGEVPLALLQACKDRLDRLTRAWTFALSQSPNRDNPMLATQAAAAAGHGTPSLPQLPLARLHLSGAATARLLGDEAAYWPEEREPPDGDDDAAADGGGGADDDAFVADRERAKRSGFNALPRQKRPKETKEKRSSRRSSNASAKAMAAAALQERPATQPLMTVSASAPVIITSTAISITSTPISPSVRLGERKLV